MSTTPVLDLEQPLPKARFHWVTYFVGVPVILLVLLVPALSWTFWDDAPELNGWLLLPGFYVAIIVHELGHVVAGKLAGLPTGAFSVGGVRLTRSGDRWVLRFDSRLILGGFVVPFLDWREYSRARLAWLIAGGPIASVLFAVGCWFAFARFGEGPAQWISSLFWAAAMALAGAVIPSKSMGIRSDSARLWQLYRHPEEAGRWVALVALSGDEMKGVRPRDWDATLVEQIADAGAAEGYYAGAQMMMSLRATDRGEDEQALLHIENALVFAARQGNKRAMKMCFPWAATLSADVRHNAAQARAWLERAQKIRGVKIEDSEGVEADIAIAQGRFADALGHLVKRKQQIEKKGGDSGLIRFAKDRLTQREESCRRELAIDPALSARPIAAP